MTQTELPTLKELVTRRDSSEVPIKVFYGHNLGNGTFALKMPIYELFRMSQVANERGDNGEPVAQRKLDPQHAHKLAVYILRGLVSSAINARISVGTSVTEAFYSIQNRLGKQPYMSLQPIVANIRTCERDGGNMRGVPLAVNDETVAYKFFLGQRDILWIVDGQHRRKGMDLVFQFLEEIRTSSRYPKKKQSLFPSEESNVSPEEQQVWQECTEVARGMCSVLVEVHLGLGIEEERQLFHDLNNLAKKVETSLALEFDSANPVNSFIKEKLVNADLVKVIDKDVVNWVDDTGALARKDLVAVNAHLFLNKSNINGALPVIVQKAEPIAKRFWESVCAIEGFGEEGAKQRTVAAQPVVLKALAKLTYDFAFGRKMDESNLDRLLDGISDFDFSHANPMWRYYELTQIERDAVGLSELAKYLPSEIEGRVRDLGSYDANNKVMRFGAKHNDIFPILGDMIRWKLNLSSRHETAAL